MGQYGLRPFWNVLAGRDNLKRSRQVGTDEEQAGQEVSMNFSFKGKSYHLTLIQVDWEPPSADKEQLGVMRRWAALYGQNIDAVLFCGDGTIFDDSRERDQVVNLVEDVYKRCHDIPDLPFFFVAASDNPQDHKTYQKFIDALDVNHKYLCPADGKITQDQIDFLFNKIFSFFDAGHMPASVQVDLRSMDISSVHPISKIYISKGVGLAGKSDPYCKVYIGPKFGAHTSPVHTTKAKGQAPNPIWTAAEKNVCKFDFSKYKNDTLYIEIWVKELFGKDRLGFCQFPVAQLLIGELELSVKPVKKEKATGSIWIFVE